MGTAVHDTNAATVLADAGAEFDERGLFHAITAQVARYYGIPTCCVAGLTDSKIVDVQAGYEKAFQFAIAALYLINLRPKPLR